VPSYRIGQVARLFGVSDDTVRRWTDSGRLPVIRDASGRRTVDGAALAEFAHGLANEPGERAAVRSARNRLTGLVTNVRRDGVMAQVDVVAGPFRLMSLISREAADQLGLAPGVLVEAVIKATNVAVEAAAETRQSSDGEQAPAVLSEEE
jgi:molybdopterin-binding protein